VLFKKVIEIVSILSMPAKLQFSNIITQDSGHAIGHAIGHAMT
jgi:hypothetical protein